MKKLNLAKLALFGIVTGLLSSSQASLDAKQPSSVNQIVVQNAEIYICANYNNCGLCGGKCNIKNPETPGLTPEQKKQAEEYQAKHKDEKAKGDESNTDKSKKDKPSAPGKEDCGVFCAANDSNPSQTTSNSAKMSAKRQNLR